jgi:hypothetical protein
MVELQIVVLAVAGSSPVGHPGPRCRTGKAQNPNPSLKAWDFRRQAAWHVRCLNPAMLNPAIVDFVKTNDPSTYFWNRILNNEELQHADDLEKLVVGCEIIAALDAVDLLAA